MAGYLDQQPKDDASPTWGDYGSSIAQGAQGLAADMDAAARFMAGLRQDDAAQQYFGASEQLGRQAQQSTIEGMTPTGRSRLEESIVSGEFLAHPFSASALKLAGMSAPIAMSILPAAPLRNAVSMTAAMAMAGGTVNTGQVLGEFNAHVDKMSHEELLKEAPVYRGYIDLGLNPEQARERFRQDMQGGMAVANFIVGAVANSFSPAAQLTRVAGGQGAIGAIGASRVGRAAATGTEAAALGSTQSGVGNYSVQSALMQGGVQKEFNDQALIDAVLQPLPLTFVPGATAGFVSKGHGVKPSAKPEVKPSVEAKPVTTPEQATPGDVPHAGRTETPPPPHEDAKVGDEQNKVVGSGTGGAKEGPPPATAAEGAKGRKAVATSKKKEAPAASIEIAPDVREAISVKNSEDPPVPKATDIVANVERQVANAVTENTLTREVTRPPEVTQQVQPEPQIVQPPAEMRPLVGVPEAPKELTSGLPKRLSTEQVTTPEVVQPKPVAERRVLADTSKESVANAKAQVAAQRVNEKRLAPPKEAKGVANYSIPEKAARAERDSIADTVLKKYPARENETGPQTLERAHAMITELGPQLAALKEKHGLKGEEEKVARLPQSRRGKTEDYVGGRGALAALVEAEKLVNWIQGLKKPPTAKVLEARAKRFRDAERMPDKAVESDRVEGDIANKAKQKEVDETPAGHVEEHLAESPEDILARKQEEDTSTEITYAPKEETKVSEKLKKVRELKERGATEGEKTAAAEAEKRIQPENEDSRGNPIAEQEAEIAARREKARAEKYEAQPAAKAAKVEKAGTFSEKRPPSKEVAERLASLRKKKEKSDAEVTREVTASLPVEPDIPRGWDSVESDHLTAQQVSDIFPTNAHVLGESPAHRVLSMGTTTVRDAYEHLLSDGTITRSEFARFVDKRLLHLAGDTPVHFIPTHDFARLIPRAIEKWGFTPGGYHDPGRGHIVMDARWLAQRHIGIRTLMHEATHVITTDILSHNDTFRNSVGRLVEIAQIHVDRIAGAGEHRNVYGLTSVKEFVSELNSNPEFQKLLKSIQLPLEARAELEKKFGRLPSHLQTLWDAFVHTLRVSLGLKEHQYTALEAALTISSHIEHEFEATRAARIYGAQHTDLSPSKIMDHMERGVIESVTEAVHHAITRPEMQKQASVPWLLKTRMFNDLANVAERFFPKDSNPVRKIYEYTMRSQTFARRKFDEALDVVKQTADAERKYKNTGEFTKLAELELDASYMGVHPDVPLTHATNEHLHFKKIEHQNQVQARAAHPELHKAFNSLPKDLQELYKVRRDYFAQAQRDMTLKTISNRVLAAIGKSDDALAQRIFDRKTTQADEAAIGKDTIKQIQDAFKLLPNKGPYFPSMRRGTHYAGADIPIPQHANARKVEDGVFEFKGKAARKEAAQYARDLWTKNGLPAEVKKVWTDKDGNTHVIDDGVEVKISSKDIDVEPRYRVRVENQHTEFLPTAKEALIRSAQLEAEFGKDAVRGAERRHYEHKSGDNSMTPVQMQGLIKSLTHRKGYESMSEAQREMMKTALRDYAVVSMGSTRIQSKRLPRRRVAGASTNATRNTFEYAHSVSQHLGRLEYAPQVEAAYKEMRSGAKNDYTKETSLGRSHIIHETERRMAQPLFEETATHHAWIKRALTLSFLDKLAGPSTSVVNATQTAMLTAPTLAARHGWGRTFSELRRAYSDVSGLTLVGQGFKNMKNAALGRDTSKTSDTFMKGAKTAGERDMFTRLMDIHTLDPEAGIEISLTEHGASGATAKLDKGLNLAATVFRQMPKAVEAINRASSALAAYRLEFAKSGDHEKAVKYANEAVENTHFVYDWANLPPLFRHPLARLALQFKTYGVGVYTHLGNNIGKAIRNLEPGDRKEALKTLGNIAAMHVAMAGALGLPTEPIKYMLLPFTLFGGPSMEDVEDKGRRLGAALFGKTGGELAMRGLPRLLGIDLSGRIGLADLTSQGGPHKATEEATWAWLAKSAAGAPAGLAFDWGKGAQLMYQGDFLKGSELIVPLKTYSDTIRAYRQGTEGKKNQAGTREKLSAYGPGEAVARTLGFTPRREAEKNAEDSAFYRHDADLKEKRQGYINKWITAKPDAKREAWSAIQKYNQGRPSAEQIKMSELTASQKRLEQSKKNEVNGVVTNKRNKHLMDNSPYVTR